MRKKKRNLTLYIAWKLAYQRYLPESEYQALIEKLQAEGQEVTASKTKLCDWCKPLSYHIDKKRVQEACYMIDENHRTCIYWLHYKRQASEMNKRLDAKTNGLKAKIKIHAKFEDLNKKSIEEVYGTVPAKDFKWLVPKPDYYINKRLKFREVEAHYIDVTSMYPACACGKLPDAKTAITINSYAEPTEEYPFAFYLKSHHVAEYGVFDTRDYLKLKPFERMCWQTIAYPNKKPVPIYEEVNPEDEITVLMKPAEIEMTETWKYFFQAKSEATDEESKNLYKFVLNAGIGTFHPNPEEKSEDYKNLYHIAAIIIGRANKKQIDMYDKIVADGGVVIQQIVDSIIYTQSRNFGIEDKVLGEYYDEFGENLSGEKIYYRSPGVINRYVIYNKNKEILKAVVSGVEDPVIEKPEDIDKYITKEKGEYNYNVED